MTRREGASPHRAADQGTAQPHRRGAALALVLAACGGSSSSRPPDGATVDAPAPDAADVDATPQTLTIRVAVDGDDARNGVDMPVRTLKRAIAIATDNARVTTIVIAPGTYSKQTGEAFPYTVPAGVIVSGPAAGGVTLAGSGTETGLDARGGRIRFLRFDSFALALDVAGDIALENLVITTSAAAVHGAAAANLVIDHLEVIAPGSGCATGIAIDSGASIRIATLSTRDLGVVLRTSDAGIVEISHASVVARLPGTACPGAMITIATTKSFAITDSEIDGGIDTSTGSVGPTGIRLIGLSVSGPTPATFTSTSLHNLATGVESLGMALQISGGTFTANFIGIDIDGLNDGVGTASLSRVTLDRNNGVGVKVRGLRSTARQTLTLRDCSVSRTNGSGVLITDFVTADLGTPASPGGNTITGNLLPGVNIVGAAGRSEVTAVGNTWRPNTQGSDATGHYPVTETIPGPIPVDVGTNFAIADGCSLMR